MARLSVMFMTKSSLKEGEWLNGLKIEVESKENMKTYRKLDSKDSLSMWHTGGRFLFVFVLWRTELIIMVELQLLQSTNHLVFLLQV